jgi:hypothetical protein
MKEERITILTQQREQMLRLRNDDSLICGVTFNTVAGDIRIDNKETALVLIDYLISDIQKQINYLSKE